MAKTEIQMSDPDMTMVGDETEIRASVTAAMRGSAQETAGEGAAPDPAAPSAEAGKPAERPGDTSRVRGPDGKFIDKTAEPADPKAATPSEKTPEVKEGGEAQAKPSPAVPDTLSTEDKATFQKLTPEAQQVVARREAHWHQALSNKGREVTQLRQKFGAIDQVIDPYRPQMQKLGITEDQALRQLFGLRDFALKNPKEFLLDWAKQHNIDVADLAGNPSGEPEYVDPALKQINDRLSTFEQQRAAERQAAEQAERQRQEAEAAATQSEIEKFQQSVDDKGNPKYPHGQKLWNLMIPIAAQIRQQHPEASHAAILHVAYQHAERQHPDTHALLIEKARADWERAQTAKQLETAKAEEARKLAKVKEATRSAGSVTGSPGPGGAAPATGSDSVEDDVRASIRSLAAGRA